MTRSEINRLVIALTQTEQSLKKDMATQISYFCKKCVGTFAEGHEEELLAMDVVAALGWIDRKGQPVVIQEADMEADTEVVKTKRGRKAKADKPVVEKTEGARKGRQSAFVGKRIYALIEANPRKTASVARKTGNSQVPWGYNAMKIVLEAGADGIAYEDYLAKGGRPNDLKFDLNKGHVEVR